jgi:uncharacterized repeat protein (TIGR04138 family)
MAIYHPKLTEIVRRDSRYAPQAYDFLFEGLTHTQKLLGRAPDERADEPGPQHHVSGQELLHGLCDLAKREFGLMARTVFRLWGINRTDDFGEMIFNLIDAKLLSKTESDSKEDFQNVFDLDKALREGYSISVDAGIWASLRKAER